MDSDYYDSTNDPIPLKGSLVRLSQNKSSSRFVPFLLQVAPYSLSIIDSLAQGGHARVFIARNMQNMTCAVKIQFPPHAYEYCMLKRIITKLGPSSSKIAVRPISCQHFQNASCLVMEYCSQGTLLAAVNKIKMAIPQATSTATLGVAEPLAMFLTIRLLECVITIHRNGFVHGDIKPDNVMLNFQTLETETSGKYAAIIYAGHDDEYWVLKHIKMIDFGRAIDLNMFPCGQTFIASWDTNPNDDPPQTLRHGEWEPWVLDYWGIAKVIHCLLFGQHMQVVPAGQQWTTRQPLKRWWHTPIWKKTFNVLLNPTQNLPITDLLRNIQNEMKIILIERDCKSNKRLSSMIVELENLLE
ncbi:kinase-like domain-containing protein [Umbelopsis sp. PMI_123]|nr:kinase-like domain-containing protein [Umbelopsis sp. PMI_123]